MSKKKELRATVARLHGAVRELDVVVDNQQEQLAVWQHYAGAMRSILTKLVVKHYETKDSDEPGTHFRGVIDDCTMAEFRAAYSEVYNFPTPRRLEDVIKLGDAQASLEVQLALNPLITDAAWAVGEMIGDPITAMPVVEKPREIENLLCVCGGILKYGLLASNRDKAALSQAVDDAECWLLNNCLSETTTD